ncbi:MAG TPA: tRNA (guanosine(37)-N1)-methyltransferase TrmD [Phycisphaerales bacterium]|nr:tRNA (guanosine(37)-N1)-methyltransferase TrmD [Phycisphaerales bacterium]
MRIDVLTTFPELFTTVSPGVLGVSIPGRAIKAGLLSVEATDIRGFTHDKHSKTDDRPFGGGPGMVMMCQPVWDAVMAVEARDARPATRILLTPQGTPLSQEIVEDLAKRPRLLMIAGHYEGIDERVIDALDPVEISIGDYVLSGGELAALVLIDAITRLLPGATGDEQSPQQDSFGNVAIPPQAKGREPTAKRLLDCPHYTKPREWQGREVPPVLLSGDHTKIAAWRLQQRMERTFVRRPDLLEP